MAVKSSQDEKDPEKGTCFTCLFPHLPPIHAEGMTTDQNKLLSLPANGRTSLTRQSLTFIRRQHRSHPFLTSVLNKHFKLHTIGLENMSRNATTSKRIITDIECFRNRAFRALFDKRSDDNDCFWFVGYDEDAISKMDVDLSHLKLQKNVILLRRPLCVSRLLINLIESPTPEVYDDLPDTSDQAMSERVNPVLPVTRDRARDEGSREGTRQVKFALPSDETEEDAGDRDIPSIPTDKCLPLHSAHALACEVKKSPDKSQVRILLVEDNKINSKLGITLLRKCGITAVAAEDGQEALDLIFADPDKFALILMDCQMPVMDGFTATRKIRQWERARGAVDRLPIIALTANVSAAAEKECLEAGADKFLPKPLTMKNLRDEISTRLGLGE